MELYFEEFFPNLAASGYEITSEASSIYNCIAWAAGDTTDWWDLHPRAYWPPSVPRSWRVEALVQVFTERGYSICENTEKETGYEKVAICARNGLWEHEARQLDDGRWTTR